MYFCKFVLSEGVFTHIKLTEEELLPQMEAEDGNPNSQEIGDFARGYADYVRSLRGDGGATIVEGEGISLIRREGSPDITVIEYNVLLERAEHTIRTTKIDGKEVEGSGPSGSELCQYYAIRDTLSERRKDIDT